MPVQHAWERGVLVIAGEGYYPFDEFMAPIRGAILAESRREPFTVLADLSRSESILLRPTREIVRGAREVALCRRYVRKAAAVVGSTVVYGIARMGQTYASLGGMDASVFWTREEAMAWLLEGSPHGDAELETNQAAGDSSAPRRPRTSP